MHMSSPYLQYARESNTMSLKCLQSQISDATSVALPVAPSAAAVAEEAVAAVAEEAAATTAEEAAAAASKGIPIDTQVSVRWSKEHNRIK